MPDQAVPAPNAFADRAFQKVEAAFRRRATGALKLTFFLDYMVQGVDTCIRDMDRFGEVPPKVPPNQTLRELTRVLWKELYEVLLEDRPDPHTLYSRLMAVQTLFTRLSDGA